MLRLLARFILRFPGWVVFFGLLLTLPSIYWTTRLYSNLKLDLEELLPRQAQSVRDLGEVRSRLQTVENLSVLVFSNDIEASRRFVEDLAARLKTLPPEVSAGVEYRINREVDFFDRRKALFIDLKDLKKIRNYIEDRLDYERELYNPLNIFSEIEIPEPKLDIQRSLLKYRGQEQAARFSRYPNGYYATPDQRKRALLVYLPAGYNTIYGRIRLRTEVDRAIAALGPKSYSPDLEVHFTGEVQNNIDEYNAVLQDVQRSAIVVGSVVTGATLLYFKTFLGVLALFLSLLFARFWTFAVTWFSIGSLNANSAFMGSIVLGSGITYGIVLLSRYLEERSRLQPPGHAAEIAITETARATGTAALAAGLAYGSLILTTFEGFRQYGLIGFVAMLFCWISAITLLPAVLLLIERFRPMKIGGSGGKRHRIFAPIVHVLERFPRGILAVSMILAVFSILLLSRLDTERVIETDLIQLRNKDSMKSGAGYWALHQDEIFRSYLSPVVLLPKTGEAAEKIARALRDKMRADGKESLIVSVRTIQDFVPNQQREKIRVLREIRELLPPTLVDQLAAPERRLVRALLRPESFRPFSVGDLPDLIRNKFTELNGSVGKLVLVEPPLRSSRWTFDRLDRFVTDLRNTADAANGGSVAIAGNHPITRDMFAAIRHDGPKTTAVSFISVAILVILLFRKVFPAGMVLFSLALGVLWMAGFGTLMGVKINFLNFIALPIAFGIGVDYAVNIVQRYLVDPDHDVIKVLTETGSAVTLCSFTTVVGYTSLIIARNQAFVSFGQLAVAGELGTMLAAIMTLPAVLQLLERRRRQKIERMKWQRLLEERKGKALPKKTAA